MPVFSVTGDRRGESALAIAPPGKGPRDEVLIAATGVTAVDTYTGVGVRSAVEYYGRWRQQPVTFCPPSDSSVWDLLSNLMGHALPAQFTLPDDAPPAASHARDAVLPAQRLDSIAIARTITDHIPDLIDEAYAPPNAVLMGTAFGILTENALRHGADSPIGAVTAIGYEREAHALQLVVTDFGPGLGSVADPQEAVIQLVERSERKLGGLAGLVAKARTKGIDLELRIASGAGRLSWREGIPAVSEAQAVPGFTGAAILHLDQ